MGVCGEGGVGVVVILTYTHPHSHPEIEPVRIFDDRYRSKPIGLKVVSEPLLCLDIDN